MQLRDRVCVPLHSIVHDFADVIFPPYCAICGGPLDFNDRIICEYCYQSIKFVDAPFCQDCGRPLKKTGKDCTWCANHVLGLTRIRALGVYDRTLSPIIHLLKYGKKPSLAKRLGRMMSITVLRDQLLSRADLAVPVPLHSARHRERGYNQSELLANALAESLGIPLVTNALLRQKNTKSQTGLTPEQRMKNVAGSFQVKKADTLKGKKVLLVDDVMTTGSTLRFCAEALLRGGAEKVFGIICAVVPMQTVYISYYKTRR